MQPVFAALFSKAMQRYEKMNKYTKEIVDFYSSSSKYRREYRRDRRASCYQRGNSHIPQIHMHDAFGLGNALGFMKGMQRCWRYILHLVAREEATEMQGSLSQVVFS